MAVFFLHTTLLVVITHTHTLYFRTVLFTTNLHSKLVISDLPQTVPQERVIVSSLCQNTVIRNLTIVAESVILTQMSLRLSPNPNCWEDGTQAIADLPIGLTDQENPNHSEPSAKDPETNEKYVVRFVDCIQKMLQFIGCLLYSRW